MKRKKRPRTRIGTKPVLAGVLLLACGLAVLAASKKKPADDTYAIVSGTVFDPGGYALPDANAKLTFEAPAKAKPLEAVASERGEFVFRVPPGPAHYTVTVSAKGFQAQSKTVEVQDQERVEVTFQLDKQSK
jgi:Carboxypeptidase regulatory-like domain